VLNISPSIIIIFDYEEMADGRWQMEDGRWQMADGRWQIVENLPLILSFSSDVIEYRNYP